VRRTGEAKTGRQARCAPSSWIMRPELGRRASRPCQPRPCVGTARRLHRCARRRSSAARCRGEEREREREMCQRKADASSYDPCRARNHSPHVCLFRTHAHNSSLRLETRFPLPELPEKLQRGRPQQARPKPDLCVKLGRHPTREAQDEATIDTHDGVVKSPCAHGVLRARSDAGHGGPAPTAGGEAPTRADDPQNFRSPQT
jgi:hypothetical protein